MNYSQFLDLAYQLKNSAEQDPASIRTAVSRIYYGLMHNAIYLIETLDKPVLRETGHHQFIQKILMNCGHAELRLAGSMIKDLHDQRCNADYKIHQTKYESKKFAESAFLLAERIREIFDTCLASQDLAEIKVGITNYRKILGQ